MTEKYEKSEKLLRKNQLGLKDCERLKSGLGKSEFLNKNYETKIEGLEEENQVSRS